MEKYQYHLTPEGISELVQAMDADRFEAFRAKVEGLDDVSFEDLIRFLDRMIGLIH